tara:strand:+ start:136 stop:507 length:372 start_codon:yes stop_codon:yes gene_type:complete
MNYLLGLTLIGIITGILGGLVGGGAEILIVPLLTLFGLLSNLKNRIGTSLFMLLPPIGIFAALEFHNKGYVDLFAALYMGLIFTIFSYITSKFTLSINNILLRKIFGLFTIFIGFYIFLNKHE